jgi:hypothetical protein
VTVSRERCGALSLQRCSGLFAPNATDEQPGTVALREAFQTNHKDLGPCSKMSARAATVLAAIVCIPLGLV